MNSYIIKSTDYTELGNFEEVFSESKMWKTKKAAFEYAKEISGYNRATFEQIADGTITRRLNKRKYTITATYNAIDKESEFSTMVTKYRVEKL